MLSIGNFDGVHRGHQYLLGEVVRAAHAQQLKSVALTFEPLPLEVLRPDVSPPRLSTTSDRLQLIRDLGVDAVVPITFTTDVAALEAREFVEQLVSAFHPTQLVVGADFAFGRGRSGNVDVLRQLGETFGYELRVLERIGDDDQDFSSSRIRARLGAGDVKHAAELLGRPYLLRGTVVQGQRRGRELGFPTANLELSGRLLVPENGIYAAFSRTSHDETFVPSMVYVGTNPTFDEHARVVEVNLIDFDRDLYGSELAVLFVDRVRGDQRFEGVDQLIAQMHRDQDATLAQIKALSEDWPGESTRLLLGMGKGALTGDR
ncbi:MAG TPA: bifunctional riboflavin kinase/FAD synthetase [Nitrolancea sp.]